MCAIDYAEPSDVWHVTRPRARKTHTCIECGRSIQPGEVYELIKSLYDGRWGTHRTCRHCNAASYWLVTVCGGYLCYGLLEELVEHWEEGYASVGMGRLIVGMRRRWKDGADPVPDIGAVRELGRSMMRKQVTA